MVVGVILAKQSVSLPLLWLNVTYPSYVTVYVEKRADAVHFALVQAFLPKGSEGFCLPWGAAVMTTEASGGQVNTQSRTCI